MEENIEYNLIAVNDIEELIRYLTEEKSEIYCKNAFHLQDTLDYLQNNTWYTITWSAKDYPYIKYIRLHDNSIQGNVKPKLFGVPISIDNLIYGDNENLSNKNLYKRIEL